MTHLSTGMYGAAWYALWLTVMFRYSEQKTRHRGYGWRLLRKLPPFRYMKGDNVLAQELRAGTLMLMLLSLAAMPISGRMFIAGFWGPQIVLILDDHFNGGDDERKRRWESLKNKIQWKQPKPAMAKS